MKINKNLMWLSLGILLMSGELQAGIYDVLEQVLEDAGKSEYVNITRTFLEDLEREKFDNHQAHIWLQNIPEEDRGIVSQAINTYLKPRLQELRENGVKSLGGEDFRKSMMAAVRGQQLTLEEKMRISNSNKANYLEDIGSIF